MANTGHEIQESGHLLETKSPSEQFEVVNSSEDPPTSGEAGQKIDTDQTTAYSVAGHGVMSLEQNRRVVELARLSLPPMR